MAIAKPAASASKAAWRSWAKEQRRTLPPDHSAVLVAALSRARLYQQAEHILSYLPFGSEIDLTALHQDSSKSFYVTRTEGDTLSLHPLAEVRLERHPWGMQQPVAGSSEVAAELIDLVLVPGLCFDRQGFRLGYGKGYYDRLLPSFRRIPFLGITAETLLVTALPHHSDDVAMTHLLSETGLQVVND